MTRVVFGRTTAEVERKLGGEPRERLHTRGVIVGAPNEIVEQLGALAEAGGGRHRWSGGIRAVSTVTVVRGVLLIGFLSEKREYPDTFDRDLTVTGVNTSERRETRDPGI